MNIEPKIAVIGLGYVGLPLAIAFSKHYPVVGFDISEARIAELKDGDDGTNELTRQELLEAQIHYSSAISDLKTANFYIVTVPTPIDSAKRPDLAKLVYASELVGQSLSKGDIVVYESTVYPGVTEDICIPVLEKSSGLRPKKDFFVGYSPERINPGDKEHTFTKIKKIVSAQTPESLAIVASVYKTVVEAGVHEVSSIKTAEAAKVIENTQRDLNVALVNELAIIFDKMEIDTLEVLEAAGTKWNFLNFRPGLVGGHCIGVDPYYLTHKAEVLGLNPQVVLAGRRINDSIGEFIAGKLLKKMAGLGYELNTAKVGILGLTFKEGCPDVRNTKVIDIYNTLREYGVEVLIHDPIASSKLVKRGYGIELVEWSDLKDLTALILAVAHTQYKAKELVDFVSKLTEPRLLFDVKGALDKEMLQQMGVTVCRL